MEMLRLGRSGLRVSPLALGTAAFGDSARSPWSVGADGVWPLVSHAFDRGISLFDTGTSYGGGLAEVRLGEALHRLDRRQDVTIVTKVYFPAEPGSQDRGLSRRHLIAALDRSLARLRTDYVDMLMIHRWDREAPVEETLSTLDGFVRSGRVRYLGASSMSAWRLMKMLGLQRSGGMEPFVAMQGHYNLLYREEEREMIPLCREEGLGYMAWSPLARGRLAGPRADPVRLREDRLASARFDAALDQLVLDALDKAAGATGLPHAALALGWLAGRGAIPVVGPSTPAELDVALEGLRAGEGEDVLLAAELAYRPHGVIGFSPLEEQPLL